MELECVEVYQGLGGLSAQSQRLWKIIRFIWKTRPQFSPRMEKFFFSCTKAGS